MKADNVRSTMRANENDVDFIVFPPVLWLLIGIFQIIFILKDIFNIPLLSPFEGGFKSLFRSGGRDSQ